MVSASSDLATRLRRIIPFVMAGLGIFFIAGGVLINYFKTNQNISSNLMGSESVGSVAGQIAAKSIKVDISGAVERPGVYSIPYDSRVTDVLITAGGLSPKADRMYISRYINLAQRLVDGSKVYFPFEGEAGLASNVGFLGSTTNINTASASELDALPGIGMVTVNKIIAGRPYQNISELTSRGVVTKSVFEKIKDKIAVN